MEAVEYNITTQQAGSSFSGVEYTLVILNEDESTTPVDLTNAEVLFAIFSSDGGQCIREYSVGNGVQLTDAANGVLTVDGFYNEPTPHQYFYTLTVTDAGEINTYVKGNLTVV